MAKEKFKLNKLLGFGAFAMTYLVEVKDEKLIKEWGNQVVVKIPHDRDKEQVLIQELIHNASLSQNLKNVNSENIVKYLGFESFDDKYVMVMEYVESKSLRDIVGKIGQQTIMTVDESINIIKQVCAGLIILHRYHIFHRDIKPDNIIICKNNIVKITDLGISKFITASELATSTSGTLYYMPKELLKGKGGAFYSDIYSLGVTFYELVTGSLPFFAESPGELIDKICNEDPIEPKNINPEIDDELNLIILKSLKKDIRERYTTAIDFLDVIENYQNGLNKKIEIAWDRFREGDINEAGKLFKGIVDDFPNNAKSYLNLGEFYNRCHRYNQAIRIFKKGIGIRSDYSLLYRNMAFALYKEEKKNEAIINLKKSIELGMDTNLKKHAEKLLKNWEI